MGIRKTPKEKRQKERKNYNGRESLAWERMPNFFKDVPFRMMGFKLIQHPISVGKGSLLHLNYKAYASVKI